MSKRRKKTHDTFNAVVTIHYPASCPRCGRAHSLSDCPSGDTDRGKHAERWIEVAR